MEENKLQEPEKGFNLTIDNFKSQLQVFISESRLPISVVYYIMKDTTRDLENLYNETVNQEYSTFKQESQEYFKHKERLEKQEESEEE